MTSCFLDSRHLVGGRGPCLADKGFETEEPLMQGVEGCQGTTAAELTFIEHQLYTRARGRHLMWTNV